MIGITIIRGLPGSGKSTLARSLNITHFESDMFHTDWKGCYTFNPEKISDAHKWCFEQVEKAVKARIPVVVSNTFTRVFEMMPYFELAKYHRIPVTVIHTKGEYGNIHGVPQHTLNNMRNRWEYFPEGTFFQSEHR